MTREFTRTRYISIPSRRPQWRNNSRRTRGTGCCNEVSGRGNETDSRYINRHVSPCIFYRRQVRKWPANCRSNWSIAGWVDSFVKQFQTDARPSITVSVIARIQNRRLQTLWCSNPLLWFNHAIAIVLWDSRRRGYRIARAIVN